MLPLHFSSVFIHNPFIFTQMKFIAIWCDLDPPHPTPPATPPSLAIISPVRGGNGRNLLWKADGGHDSHPLPPSHQVPLRRVRLITETRALARSRLSGPHQRACAVLITREELCATDRPIMVNPPHAGTPPPPPPLNGGKIEGGN